MYILDYAQIVTTDRNFMIFDIEGHSIIQFYVSLIISDNSRKI